MKDIPLKFDEKKTTQAAAILLRKHGGPMEFLKLLKLLYLADRQSLLRSGRSITCDRYVSMDHGPVLSMTYDLISNGTSVQKESFWLQHISVPADYRVKVLNDPGNSELSEVETQMLEEVYATFGNWDQWKLVDEVMHVLPEWEDPNGSSIPIAVDDILTRNGKTPLEAASIENELESLSAVQQFFRDK